MPHLLQLTDWSKDDIHNLLDRAKEIEKGHITPKVETFVVNLFFEPSTRTRFSFEVAEKRLGMNVLNFASESSSTKKGETLYDTLRTIESMGVEIAVIRHPEEGYYENLKDRLGMAIINGGDGTGHHPTQTLLDLMTIRQEFGKFDGLTVAMIGDISHSRVARSNALMLEKLGARVIFSGPPEWQNERFSGSYVSIDEAIQTADVVNMLRIQKERHGGAISQMSNDQYHEAYGLTVKRASQMKQGSIIMHPGPFNRGVEIADELVEHPKSKIFKQVHNGVPVRMAVLEWAMTTSKKVVTV
jgi:aspartate carbamoyltransferase catalytic subunit